MSQSIVKRIRALLIVPLLAVSIAVGVAQPSFAAPDATCDKAISISEGVDCSKGADQSADLFGTSGVFKTITDVLLFIIGAISVIMLIIGGIRYTVSGGDSAAVKSAKDTILYAIVGIIVAILAYAIVGFVVGSFVA